MTPAQQLGQNLNIARRRALLSQADLAAKLGYQQRAISKLENGQSEMRVETLVLAADACDVTVTDLLAGIEPKDWHDAVKTRNSSNATPTPSAPAEIKTSNPPSNSRKATGKAPPRAPRKRKTTPPAAA
jgi:transcriptional regulator with XRE-family HTH domain